MKNSIFYRIRKNSRSAQNGSNVFCSLDPNSTKLVLNEAPVSKEVIERYFQKDSDISKHHDGLLASAQIFKADGVFHQEATNSFVYEETMKSIVTSFVSGKNTAFFVIGGAGSGKKHTVFGDKVKEKGLLALAYEQISKNEGKSL